MTLRLPPKLIDAVRRDARQAAVGGEFAEQSIHRSSHSELLADDQAKLGLDELRERLAPRAIRARFFAGSGATVV
jgi:hypothetical protein